MGQILGNTLASRNYKAMASVARSQGRARLAAHNLKASNLEEEARADTRLAARNMGRVRENQASGQSSERARRASSGFAPTGSALQNELALADVFEKTLSDMVLSHSIADQNKRSAAMASRQQGILEMMQAGTQANQYARLAKSSRNAAWIQGGSTLLSGTLGALSSTGAGQGDGVSSPAASSPSSTATAGTTLPSWLTPALSSGQSAYDLSGNFLQWSPGGVTSGRESTTNAGNSLSQLLMALLGRQGSDQPRQPRQPRQP